MPCSLGQLYITRQGCLLTPLFNKDFLLNRGKNNHMPRFLSGQGPLTLSLKSPWLLLLCLLKLTRTGPFIPRAHGLNAGDPSLPGSSCVSFSPGSRSQLLKPTPHSTRGTSSILLSKAAWWFSIPKQHLGCKKQTPVQDLHNSSGPRRIRHRTEHD